MAVQATTAAGAALEIKLIHIGRSALGMDDATYRAMLARLCSGKTSSKALTGAERQAVLAHMKASGFTVKPRGKSTSPAGIDWQREPQLLKLRALWYLLADAGAVERPADTLACNAAIEAWAKRQFSARKPPLDALRFASGPQMNDLVEQAKQWARRVGAPVHS